MVVKKRPDMIVRKLRELHGHEREAYKAGGATKLDAYFKKDMSDTNHVNAAGKLNKEEIQNKIAAIFGQEAADEVREYMNASARMFA